MRVRNGMLAVVYLIVAPSIGHGQRTDQAKADRLFKTAATAYQAKDWNLAAGALQTFVSSCPEDERGTEMRFFLGEACFQAGQFQPAHAAYEAFLESLRGEPHASEATARFRLGETAYLMGDVQQAQVLLRDFVARYPNHGHVQYALPYLADLASRQSDHREVVRLAEKINSRTSVKNFEVDYLAAQALGQLGSLDKARAICRRAALEPALANVELGYRFALLAAELDWQACPCTTTLRAFQRVATSAAPAAHRRQAMIRVAECCTALGDNRKAIATLRSVLAEFPEALPPETVAQQIMELQAKAPPS